MLINAVLSVVLSATAPLNQSVPAALETAQSWQCQPRKTCKRISSCDEALWYLENCSWGGALDRDGDGRPCETLCDG
jgi:hypothetical protein